MALAIWTLYNIIIYLFILFIEQQQKEKDIQTTMRKKNENVYFQGWDKWIFSF